LSIPYGEKQHAKQKSVLLLHQKVGGWGNKFDPEWSRNLFPVFANYSSIFEPGVDPTKLFFFANKVLGRLFPLHWTRLIGRESHRWVSIAWMNTMKAGSVAVVMSFFKGIFWRNIGLFRGSWAVAWISNPKNWHP